MIGLITKLAKEFFMFVFGIYLRGHTFDQNTLKTISLYSRDDKFVQAFTKIRFWDAPYIEAENLLPKKGTILDVGCGEGLFSNFLAICSPNRDVVGVDIDKNRLKEAQKGLKNTKYIFADISKITPKAFDAIVMMHVLHHLKSFDEQEVFILNYSKLLKKGGTLLIGEAEPKFSIKHFFVLLTDHFIVPILFERRLYSPIYFRSLESWKRLLLSQGFKVTTQSADEGKPFTHVILNCKKI